MTVETTFTEIMARKQRQGTNLTMKYSFFLISQKYGI